MTDFTTQRVTMVDTQIRPSDVTSYTVIAALLAVPREAFVPAARRDEAYADENIDLGEGRVVLAPRTFAKMLEALDLQSDELVLDVASGPGYGAAVLARLADFVVALEENEAMGAEAQETLSQMGIDNVAVVTGPLTEGAARHGPYDVIVFEGAIEQLPETYLSQLKEGGRVVALWQQGRLGEARIGYRIDGQIAWRHLFNAGAPVLPGFEAHREFVL